MDAFLLEFLQPPQSLRTDLVLLRPQVAYMLIAHPLRGYDPPSFGALPKMRTLQGYPLPFLQEPCLVHIRKPAEW